MADEVTQTGQHIVWQQPTDAGEPREGMLFGAEQLNREETERLLAQRPARVTVLLGERRAGKTTLFAELYDRQRHNATEASFAGSWTLLAFEQLAYQRRTTGTVPGTGMPAPGDRDILHLALASGDADPMHLLFADFAGELVTQLADNQVAVKDIPWLAQGDKLVFVVDGEQLSDPVARSGALTRVRQLLERLQSNGLPKVDAKLALLVTKWDLVNADLAALTYWEPREAKLLEDLRAIDAQALALRITAEERSPRDGFAGLRRWLLEVTTDEFADPFDVWNAPLGQANMGEVEVEVAPSFFEPPQRRRRWWSRR